MAGREGRARETTRAARELAHAASYLASEAASLARVFEAHHAHEESAGASGAAVRAAENAFRLDEMALSREPGTPLTLEQALRHARLALDAAAESVACAKDAVAKASLAAAAGDEPGLGTS